MDGAGDAAADDEAVAVLATLCVSEAQIVHVRAYSPPIEADVDAAADADGGGDGDAAGEAGESPGLSARDSSPRRRRRRQRLAASPLSAKCATAAVDAASPAAVEVADGISPVVDAWRAGDAVPTLDLTAAADTPRGGAAAPNSQRRRRQRAPGLTSPSRQRALFADAPDPGPL